MRRVVVTGLGMVSPVGNDVKTSWKNALEARSGVASISAFPTEDLSVKIGAFVKNFDPGDLIEVKDRRRVTPFCQFAAFAAREALTDAGLLTGGARERMGAAVGVGIGGIESIENSTLTLKDSGPKRISPFFMPYCIPNMAAGVVSLYNDLRGPNICPTTACASGTHAVGEGWLYIRSGLADVMVAGGAEAAISRLSLAAFASLKALSSRNDAPEQASRPFDVDRDGFVMGEGSGLVVLEELEHAKKRGAKIYAELVGFGMSGDAHHITAPSPEGDGARRCMELALKSGNIAPSDIDYINAHGTSTGLNDKYESAAITRLFGDDARKVAVSSTKGVTGHCLGAAGGIEAVFTALAVHHAMMPPTANLTNQDPDCTLDCIPLKARERRIRYAMSNSFGFGGTNGTIVMKRFD